MNEREEKPTYRQRMVQRASDSKYFFFRGAARLNQSIVKHGIKIEPRDPAAAQEDDGIDKRILWSDPRKRVPDPARFQTWRLIENSVGWEGGGGGGGSGGGGNVYPALSENDSHGRIEQLGRESTTTGGFRPRTTSVSRITIDPAGDPFQEGGGEKITKNKG